MKKISILMSLIAIMGTSASAMNIDVDVSLRKITVTASDTLMSPKPTLQILDKNRTKAIYTAEGILSGTEYVFDTYSMGLDEESDTYIVRVGENGHVTEKEIYYAAYREIMAALNMADSENVTSQGMVDNYAKLLGVNEIQFNKLPDAWKNRITSEIDNLIISTENEVEIKSGIDAIINIFNKWLNYSTLALSDDAIAIDNAVKAVAGLDLKYYEKLTDKKHISDAFAICSFNPETVTETKLFEYLDGAIATGVVIQNDWATGKEVVNYYTTKGLFVIDSKYLNAGAATYKALREKQVKDYTEIPATLKALYSSPPTHGGSSGGGGGGQTIDDTISVSMGSGASSVVATPNTQTGEHVLSSEYSDISDVPWATEAIVAFSKSGVIVGKGNGIFAPNDTMSRAEFVKVIVLAFGLVDDNAIANFNDVSTDAWYYKYVASAKQTGIISGISDTLFAPDKRISREEMAVIAVRLAEKFGIDLSGTAMEFSDENEISDYAYSAINKLSGAGIINGMGDGSFSPKSHVTRAQGVKVIYDISSRKE